MEMEVVRNDRMLTQSLVNTHIGRARNRERRVRHPDVQCTVNLSVGTHQPPHLLSGLILLIQPAY